MIHAVVQKHAGSAADAATLLIVDAGNSAAADLAEQWAGCPVVDCAIGEDERQITDASEHVDSIVVMLPQPWCRPDDERLQAAINIIQETRPRQACFVTSCASHFAAQLPGSTPADSAAEVQGVALDATEALLRDSLPEEVQVTIVRCGMLLSDRAQLTQRLRRLGWLTQVLPASMRSTFVTVDDLARLLSDVLAQQAPQRFRTVTLLGQNQTWRDAADSCRRDPHSLKQRMTFGISRLLAICGVGIFLHSALRLWSRRRPELRVLSFDTLTPGSEQELLSLCHRHNLGHIAVCGYNNGVRHFGWSYGSKTVVPTIRTGRVLRIDGDTATVDAGITLKQCMVTLSAADRELLVVPNYSWISMGTIFFVPVHGSGSEVSTLGDTIDWVRLYDPKTDSIEEVHRGDELFRQSMYSMDSGRVVLQLRLKTRRRTEYVKEQETWDRPSARQVWSLFNDPGPDGSQPSNVEVRKRQAADPSIQVSRYYPSSGDGDARLQVPRDALGSLWDRLEENRVTAFLFHWLVRKFAFHVELFLREDEFAVFWEQHQGLPISKIQLRMVRRDGMPNSAFCEADCVSVDLFMHKRHRREFLQFARQYLPDVRFNPGKQSMRGHDE